MKLVQSILTKNDCYKSGSSMTGQRRGMSEDGIGGKHFDKESLLYGREKDYGKGADAPFRGLSPV